MRALSELITDVRFSTNETDANRFPDERLLKFFNDAQDQIEGVIFRSCNENHPFAKIAFQSIAYDKDEYSLPSDIYAVSAIINASVLFSIGLETYTPLKKLTEKERGRGFGYVILGNKLFLTPKPKTAIVDGLKIVYVPKLIRLESVSDESQLPNTVESFLTEFVERKINAINSSADVSNSNVFTKEERERIADLFAEVHHDAQSVPIADDTYLNY